MDERLTSQPLRLPTELTNKTPSKLEPAAIAEAQDDTDHVQSEFSGRRSLDEQRLLFEGGEVIDYLREKYRQTGEADPEALWQAQWLLTFNAFYDLGASRARGEYTDEEDWGKRLGSGPHRFAARSVQTVVVEKGSARTAEPLKVKNCSVPPHDQTPVLRDVARFALAAGALDQGQGTYNSQEPLVRIIDRVDMQQEGILALLQQDQQKPLPEKLCYTDNI